MVKYRYSTRLSQPSEHDPGTPDVEVSPVRREGRIFYRNHPEDDEVATREATRLAKGSRMDFWLGWYDERLRGFYGR